MQIQLKFYYVHMYDEHYDIQGKGHYLILHVISYISRKNTVKLSIPSLK